MQMYAHVFMHDALWLVHGAPAHHQCPRQHINATASAPTMAHPCLQTVPKPIEFEMEDSQLFVSQAGAGVDELNGAGAGGKPLAEGAGVQGSAHAQAPAPAPPRALHLNIRAAFVAPPSHTLLTADYCQVGVRGVRSG